MANGLKRDKTLVELVLNNCSLGPVRGGHARILEGRGGGAAE